MSGGSVYDYLHKHKGVFKLPALLGVVMDVSKGMSYLHQNNIIHRDLKTANLLMDENGVSNVGKLLHNTNASCPLFYFYFSEFVAYQIHFNWYFSSYLVWKSCVKHWYPTSCSSLKKGKWWNNVFKQYSHEKLKRKVATVYVGHL